MAKVRKYPEAFEEYYGRCKFADSNVFHHPNQFEVVKHLMYLAWQAGRRYGKPSIVRKAVPYVENTDHERWDFLDYERQWRRMYGDGEED